MFLLAQVRQLTLSEPKLTACLERLSEKRRALFADLPDLLEPGAVNANARIVAGRLKGWDKIAAQLHARSRVSGMVFAEWKQQFLESIAIAMIQLHFIPDGASWFPDPASDPDFARAVAALNGDRGTLVLAYHCGFRQLFVEFFRSFAQDALVIHDRTGDASGENGAVSAAADPRAALFTAYRRLRAGGQVYLAPDGPNANRGRTIRVLDVDLPVAEGAAFLASQLRARVVWLCVRRDGDRFLPVIVEGPVREKQEREDDYEKRFWQFYACCIEHHLSGMPGDIAIGGRWLSILKTSFDL